MRLAVDFLKFLNYFNFYNLLYTKVHCNFILYKKRTMKKFFCLIISICFLFSTTVVFAKGHGHGHGHGHSGHHSSHSHHSAAHSHSHYSSNHHTNHHVSHHVTYHHVSHVKHHHYAHHTSHIVVPIYKTMIYNGDSILVNDFKIHPNQNTYFITKKRFLNQIIEVHYNNTQQINWLSPNANALQPNKWVSFYKDSENYKRLVFSGKHLFFDKKLNTRQRIGSTIFMRNKENSTSKVLLQNAYGKRKLVKYLNKITNTNFKPKDFKSRMDVLQQIDKVETF